LDSASWPARVREISTGGVGLLLTRPLEVGASILVELPSGTDTCSIAGRIAHCHRDPTGRWHIGCEFAIPRTEIELKAILASLPRQ
jgi:hypothetical protein